MSQALAEPGKCGRSKLYLRPRTLSSDAIGAMADAFLSLIKPPPPPE